MPTIRTSPRAVIRRGERYLTVCYRDATGDWFVFPGGGQLHDEDLHQALKREVEEETGAVAEIGRLRFVRECMASREPDGNLPAGLHQLEIFFDCRIPDDAVAGGLVPDPDQLGIAWLTIGELKERRFFPGPILDLLENGQAEYVGVC